MTLCNKIIGCRVKEFRLHKCMSQADLAEQVNMSVTYISYIETAKKKASLESLIRIANVLGVTIDQLLINNQAHDPVELRKELVHLFEDCSSYEKQIIYDVALATKRSLLENRWLQK